MIPGTGSLLAGARRLLVVRLLDGADQLLLLHRRTAGDAEPLGDGEQMCLGRVGVDPALGLGLAVAPLLGPLVAGPHGVLLLPVVADLLVGVLHSRPRHLVRALGRAVLVGRGVIS